MYMLIAVLCLQTGARDAECRRDVRGPYHTPKACLEQIPPTGDALKKVAGDLAAPVIFARVWCEKGRDI